MTKIFALLDLFRKGSSVANPALWKQGGMALQVVLVGLILSANTVAGMFGYDLNISEAQAGSIAAGVVTVVCIVFTYVTSDKVGILPAKPEVPPEGGPDRSSEDTMRAGG